MVSFWALVVQPLVPKVPPWLLVLSVKRSTPEFVTPPKQSA